MRVFSNALYKITILRHCSFDPGKVSDGIPLQADHLFQVVSTYNLSYTFPTAKVVYQELTHPCLCFRVY